MLDIKQATVFKGTIKSVDHSIASSNRIRNAASEIRYQTQKQTQNFAFQNSANDKTINEYSADSMQFAAGNVATAAERAALQQASYAAGRVRQINAYKLDKARADHIKSEVIKSSQSRNQALQVSRQAKASAHSSDSHINARIQSRMRSRYKANLKSNQQAKRFIQARQRTQSTKAIAQSISKSLRAIIEGTKALITALTAGSTVAIAIITCCVLFGAAFYFFGDESSQNYTPVSPEVEAFAPLIQKYATQYEIEEYTELIKAVMMQESGGRGLDPMQCSECGLNNKYPNKPGGIKDPEYSIKVGVHYLSNLLKLAKATSPLDMDRIRLALQGYNYGSGYITWAIKRDGGYTVENAAKFSDQQAKKHNMKSYGDKHYVAHVLRYYPYGSYNIGIGNTAITAVAAKQIGNVGGKKFWSWYGFKGRVEWCGCFVSWCADQCGYTKAGIIPKFASCPSGVNWFKSKGQWQKRSYKPAPGDIIFFDYNGNSTADHVGIVEKCDGKTITTIEGNSSNMCRRNHYNVGYVGILGYGVPKY